MYLESYIDEIRLLCQKNILSREIDLLESRALKNPYLIDNFNQTKTLLYVS